MTDGADPSLQLANAGIRALLELAALVAFAYWGYRTGDSLVLQVGLAVGIPLAVALAWGLVGAPRAPFRLDEPRRRAVELLILGGAVTTLYLAEQPALAAIFGVLAAANAAMLHVWGRPPESAAT